MSTSKTSSFSMGRNWLTDWCSEGCTLYTAPMSILYGSLAISAALSSSAPANDRYRT